MSDEESLKRARVIYKQIIQAKEAMLSAHVNLVGANIDAIPETFCNKSIKDLSGMVYIAYKETITLEQEWRGYYVARGGRIEDIRPIVSKSEES